MTPSIWPSACLGRVSQYSHNTEDGCDDTTIPVFGPPLS